jgi:hypothetical protein
VLTREGGRLALKVSWSPDVGAILRPDAAPAGFSSLPPQVPFKCPTLFGRACATQSSLERKRLRSHSSTAGAFGCVNLTIDVSADLKGSQFSRFGCEPESLAMAAGHTNTSAAVEDRQSRLRVFSQPVMVSS